MKKHCRSSTSTHLVGVIRIPEFRRGGRRSTFRGTAVVLAAATVVVFCGNARALAGNPPHAEEDSAWTLHDHGVNIQILDNDTWYDAPLDPSSVMIVDAPAHGSLMINPDTGDVWYSPDAGYYGPDNFTYIVEDTLGQSSNYATVFITVAQNNVAPQIVDFVAVRGPANAWTFNGRVIDEAPAGLVVTFGGLLAGQTTTVQPNGTFSFGKVLAPGQSGLVTARTTDPIGLVSNLAQTFVFNY
jgi:hypothetical protein